MFLYNISFEEKIYRFVRIIFLDKFKILCRIFFTNNKIFIKKNLFWAAHSAMWALPRITSYPRISHLWRALISTVTAPGFLIWKRHGKWRRNYLRWNDWPKERLWSAWYSASRAIIFVFFRDCHQTEDFRTETSTFVSGRNIIWELRF